MPSISLTMAAETVFRSDEIFDQKEFRRWIRRRPQSDVNHYELLSGRIVMTPPAGWPHGRIEVIVARRLEELVQRERLGIVLGSSTGYDLPSGDTVEPDVSYVSSRKLARGKPAPGQFLRAVPSLVVEILSRPTARRDRIEKKKIYEQNGVEEYWLVDPVHKTVTVFHLGKRGYGAGKVVATGRIPSRVLPQIDLSISAIFAV
jgi:Uma2 family endonuclease